MGGRHGPGGKVQQRLVPPRHNAAPQRLDTHGACTGVHESAPNHTAPEPASNPSSSRLRSGNARVTSFTTGYWLRACYDTCTFQRNDSGFSATSTTTMAVPGDHLVARTTTMANPLNTPPTTNTLVTVMSSDIVANHKQIAVCQCEMLESWARGGELGGGELRGVGWRGVVLRGFVCRGVRWRGGATKHAHTSGYPKLRGGTSVLAATPGGLYERRGAAVHAKVRLTRVHAPARLHHSRGEVADLGTQSTQHTNVANIRVVKFAGLQSQLTRHNARNTLTAI